MLVNLLLLKLLLFLNLTPTNSTTADVCETYCNARFEYCVDYTNHYFDSYKQSDNGDGITLFNTNSKIRLMVSGTYNVLDYTADDLVDNYLNDLRLETGRSVQFLNEEPKENGKLALYQTTNAFHFVQYVLSDDAYAVSVLVVPQQKKAELLKIKECVNLYLKEVVMEEM